MAFFHSFAKRRNPLRLPRAADGGSGWRTLFSPLPVYGAIIFVNTSTTGGITGYIYLRLISVILVLGCHPEVS